MPPTTAADTARSTMPTGPEAACNTAFAANTPFIATAKAICEAVFPPVAAVSTRFAAVASFIAAANAPYAFAPALTASNIGPNAATTAPRVTIFSFVDSSILEIHVVKSRTALRACSMYGINISPNWIPISMSWFFAISIRLANVPYRFSASSVNAVFSPHAFVLVSIAVAKVSAAPDARSNASRIRTSVISISVSTLMALSPSMPMRSKPLINASMDCVASCRNMVLNSFVVIPATLANCSSLSPPFSAASAISTMTLEKAEPPASASMPTEDSAAARPTSSRHIAPKKRLGTNLRHARNRTPCPLLHCRFCFWMALYCTAKTRT